jgi:hypothetical protein
MQECVLGEVISCEECGAKFKFISYNYDTIEVEPVEG